MIDMSHKYEVIEFNREFIVEDDVEVVAADLSAQGSSQSSLTAHNRALVRREVEDETFICGADLSDGAECGRQVSSAGERCWQHEDD